MMTLSLYVRQEAHTGSFGGLHQWTAGPLECSRVQKTQRGGVNNPGMQNYTQPPSHPLSQAVCTGGPATTLHPPQPFSSIFTASTQYFFAIPLLQRINIF